MPDEKAISKVTLNGVVLMDVTQDTVAASNLLTSHTATGADGKPVAGGFPDNNVEVLDLASNTYTRNGMTITVGEDNTLTLSGTPTALVSLNLATGVTLPKNTDCIVLYDSKAVTGVRLYVHALDSGNTWHYNIASAAPIASFNSGTYTSFAVGIEVTTSFTGTASFTVSLKHPPTTILQAKTGVTPTESSQTVLPDSDYDGMSSVQINAISSSYVGSAIDRRDSTDLTASGATVSVPAGYYETAASKSVGTTTHPNPTASVDANGLVTASHTQGTGYVTGGTTTGTLQLTTQGATTITPTTSQQTAIAVGKYTTGNVVVAPINVQSLSVTPSESEQVFNGNVTVATLEPGSYNGYTSEYAEFLAQTNIPKDAFVAGKTYYVQGAIKDSQGLNTITLSGEWTVTWPDGSPSDSPYLPGSNNKVLFTKTSSDQVLYLFVKSEAFRQYGMTIESPVIFTSKTDGYVPVTVSAISSSYVGSGITRRDDTDLTASGATVTVPAGYYAEQETKSVAAGSASTPATTITANPAISVNANGLITATASATQSVTPTVSAGYVASGTAGTVTVSGSSTSQLTTQSATTITPSTSSQTAVAAGTYTTGAVTVDPIPSEYIVPTGTTTITENGTGIDVAQYAAVDVDVQPSGVKYIWTEEDGAEGPWDVSGYQYAVADGAAVNDGHSRVWIDLTDENDLKLTVKSNSSATVSLPRTIDWGDGTIETFTANFTHTHTYEKTGKYVVDVSGPDNMALLGQYLLNQSSDATMRAKALYIEVNAGETIQTTSSQNIFKYLTSIRKVTICDNVVFRNGLLPYGTFDGCAALEEVNISNDITGIGPYAFQNCNSLLPMTLPAIITSIGDRAFQNAGSTTNKLTLTCLATTPPTLGASVFTTARLNKIYVPSASVADYKAATNWSTYADYIEAIPE